MSHSSGVLDAVPLLVPVAAVLAVLGPDALRSLRSRSPWLALSGLCSVVAALVHVVVMPSHLDEYWLFGLFFGVLAALQLGYAGLLALRPSRGLLAAGALVNAATVGLWLVSRTVGLPIGPAPGVPEPVGPLDVLSTAAELVLVVATACALRLSPAVPAPPSAPAWTRWASPPAGATRAPSR